MITIYIDKKKYYVPYLSNILQICLFLGKSLPYFCWHPILGSVGFCRQCAVKVYQNDSDTKGSIVMSCMTSIQEGMRISIADEEIRIFRKDIIELLMLNHPHDCPICSEGGSCHLQDMTVLSQHNMRRYRFRKRTFLNQYIGPFISHEMNRCITCYRCVRYYSDYADGKDFGAYGSSNKIYFGRIKEGPLESEYSGNLIDVCPTGVFTDKLNTKNFYRKWDLQYTPSVCHHCSIGCNINIGEKLGNICRIDNRYNTHINRYFLCDLGRFSYGYSNLGNRLKKPYQLINNKIKWLSYKKVINIIIKILKKSESKILGIGSTRASIESNIALYRLVGKKNFSNGMCSKLDKCMNLIINIIKNSNLCIPTISEIEQYDAILIIGEDITQTAARAALSVRQAIKNFKNINKNIKNDYKIPDWHAYAIKNIVQDKKNPLFILSIDKTKLDDISSWNYYGSIKKQEKLANCISDCIHGNFDFVKKYDKCLVEKIIFISKSLSNAKKPLIISGTSCFSYKIIQIASNIAQGLKKKGLPVGITLFSPSVNSVGSILIPGFSLDYALQRINNNKVKTLIILENDLYRFFSEHKIQKIFKKVENVIVIDHQVNKTVDHANIFLPCSNLYESSGTVINYETRAQRFFRAYISNFYNSTICVLDSWRWLHGLSMGISSISLIEKFTLDDMINLCKLSFPFLKKLDNISPNANYRLNGQKIARSSKRSSGRTACVSKNDIHEPTSPIDLDTMFSFSMEGTSTQNIDKNFSYIPFSWSPGWNSNQSSYQSSIFLENEKNCMYEGIVLYPYKNNKVNSNFITFNLSKKNKKQNKCFTIVPYYSLLHSEELSQKYLKKFNKKDHDFIRLNVLNALELNVIDGDVIEFTFCMNFFRFSVCISKKLDKYLLGLPVGSFNIPISFIGGIVTDLKKRINNE